MVNCAAFFKLGASLYLDVTSFIVESSSFDVFVIGRGGSRMGPADAAVTNLFAARNVGKLFVVGIPVVDRTARSRCFATISPRAPSLHVQVHAMN
jgi:hypothetical protein